MKNFKIKVGMLNKGLPPIIYKSDGSVNVILALYKKGLEPECGSCWQTVNTVWYNKYPENYVGWIDLEDI